MPSLTLTERSRLARLAADRTRRALVARALRSPLFAWRYGRPAAEELLLVPQELRTADPSFAEELAHGQLGLGGAVASIGNGSIFDVPAPSEAWSRALHGFGWLRNLTAAGDLRTFPFDLARDEPGLGGIDGFYAARLVRTG